MGLIMVNINTNVYIPNKKKEEFARVVYSSFEFINSYGLNCFYYYNTKFLEAKYLKAAVVINN